MIDKHVLAVKGARPIILLLGLLSLCQGAAIAGQALWLAKAVTVLFHGQPIAAAVNPLICFAAAFAARHTFVWMQRAISGKFAETTSERLRIQLLENIFERGPAAAAQAGSGRLVTLAMDGIHRVRTYLELLLPRMTDMIFVTLTLIAVVYWLDLISGLILTFTLPVLIIFFILLGYAARKLADRQWRSYQVLSGHFTDTLRGLETLRLLGRSKSYAKTIKNVSERYRSATMRTLRMAFLSSFALDFFSTLSVAFVAVGLGLRLIDGAIGLEAALAVLLIAPEYFTPVRMLGTDYHASLDGKEAWEAVRKWEKSASDAEPQSLMPASSALELTNQNQVPRAKHLRSQATSTGSERKAELQPNALANIESGHSMIVQPNAEIKLHNVAVRSDEGQIQLSGITTIIHANMRKIGIAGMSGAGKTTLLQLLGGFIKPASGTITLEEQPLQGPLLQKWQARLAFIPQHPHLFSGSLADNVRFYDPDLSDEEIMRALEKVGLLELTEQLPNGIYEQIGEGGRALSGGQAQRVALARALAGKRSVFLLDEPTAHLDIETELAMKETMLPLFNERKVFLATHRLHWMKDMDWILVMDQGRLVESGTHEQLLERGGRYSKLLAAATGGERM